MIISLSWGAITFCHNEKVNQIDKIHKNYYLQEELSKLVAFFVAITEFSNISTCKDFNKRLKLSYLNLLLHTLYQNN